MRVLICSVSSALGGMERRIEDEVRVLRSLGHEVFVASASFPGCDEWRQNIVMAGGVFVTWHPYKFIERGQSALPFRWLTLLSLPTLKRLNIDFAHIAMPWNLVGMSMAFVLSRAKIPFVVSIHCKLGGKSFSSSIRSPLKVALSGMVGGYAVSGPVRDSFMSLYEGLLPGGVSVNVVQNGVNPYRFGVKHSLGPSVRASFGWDAGHFVVLFCGRLSPMKRPTLAARAFAKFLLDKPQARLVVVGDGSEMRALTSEVIALGIKEKVTLTGHVDDTSPYYAASDCYMSTSTNEEGFSLTTAEALFAGLAAVVPDDDVYRAIYGDCAAVIRCSPSIVDAYAEALLVVATRNGAQRHEMAQLGRRFAHEKLSTETMNSQLANFYRLNFRTIESYHRA